MIHYCDLRIPIEEESSKKWSKTFFSKKIGINTQEIEDFELIKRSIDARSRNIKVNLRFAIYVNEKPPLKRDAFDFRKVNHAKKVHIIGAGPAGLFAALELIHQGFCPVVFERGKTVRERRRDIAQLTKEHRVNPDSNYCFGEGGAGTYSDGKLYTRSKKRGDVNRILEGLIQFGADENIRIDAHPHIGTNKLPKIIERIRDFICSSGGEVRFEQKLTDIELSQGRIDQIQINGSEWINVEHLILATGHSARDIFHLLHKKGIELEAKPFALGLRVEHPQSLIDQIQYGRMEREEYLPPASYRLVTQSMDRGVYSFCMCPGGIIAPCATQPGEIVTNGWSPSKRNNPYANSGIVVQVSPKDWAIHQECGPLAALIFQQELEQKAYHLVNKNEAASQFAPAQRLMDFVDGKDSTSLPKCSYTPGITAARLDQLFPKSIYHSLRAGFLEFGKKMKGYLSNDAVVVGVESRTSSPVLIPRTKEQLNHTEVENLYPCGEGAGYAGGIVSAAIDGINIASSLTKHSTNFRQENRGSRGNV